MFPRKRKIKKEQYQIMSHVFDNQFYLLIFHEVHFCKSKSFNQKFEGKKNYNIYILEFSNLFQSCFYEI